MNRAELAHVLRAAADVTGDGEILVIGSQAILGTYEADHLPPSITMSIEVDVAFFDDAENRKSDLVDGAIGEDSMFHRTYGYYGQGVSVSTAVLPDGWRDRLVPFTPPDSEPARAVSLNPEDLVLAKLVAGREKDLVFAADLLRAGSVDVDVLRERVDLLPVVGAVRRRVRAHVDRLDGESR